MENKRLFVGNLSYETTKEEIVELFSAFGKVDSISLRPNKGFAFVTMSKPEEAMAVIDNLDQTDFKDRLLRVAWELPKRKAGKMTRSRFKQTGKKEEREDPV
jgi:RNA recognition motif-containing protein